MAAAITNASATPTLVRIAQRPVKTRCLPWYSVATAPAPMTSASRSHEDSSFTNARYATLGESSS